MRELADFFDKDNFLHSAFSLAVLSAVSKAGQTDTLGIINKVRDDYLDEDYIRNNDHEIESGGSFIDKKIRWKVCALKNRGYLEKPERGIFKLSNKGKLFLDTALCSHE